MSTETNNPDTDKNSDSEAALNAVVSFSERLAHDANNYIGAVIGLSEMLPTVADDFRQVEAIAAKISAAGRLLQVVINQPLLPHISSLDLRHLDLDEALASARVLASSLVRPRIAFELTHSVGDGALGVSRAEFSAVLFILLRNAIDAIGDASGRIRVSLDETSAAKIAAEKDHIYRRGMLAEGRYLALSVTDSGGGFPEDQTPRLFQPFVSHARRPTALGLGLNFAIAIVERRQGAMEVARTKETRFSAFLPMVETASAVRNIELPEDARIVIVDPLMQWGNAAAILFGALDRAAICVVSAQAAAETLERASPTRHVVILRASRAALPIEDLQRLRDVLTQRLNVDLLILVGATFPAHPNVATMLGEMAAISLGPDAEPADIVNYLIPNI
ncbi:MAG TPA: ATP-binding protein [Parvibaculum sp.]|jgi:nitrogen-specific signal transduction histidine kinase